MTYTKSHVTQNAAMRAAALPALREVGWQPDPEPRNWSQLAHYAATIVVRGNDDPRIYRRARHQVIAVMMEYRGKPAEWK